jgi:anti-sigma regulatory factor (Ser/Thr protein kinase)
VSFPEADVRQELAFANVDEIAHATALKQDHCMTDVCFMPKDLGPFVELLMLADSGLVSDISRTASIDVAASPSLGMILKEQIRGRFVCVDEIMGFMHLPRQPSSDLVEWTKFGIAALHAGQRVGFPHSVAAGLIGAIKELHSNVYEHSDASETGLVAYQATPGVFEFVVADRGVGVLATLKTNPKHIGLAHDRDALLLALRDGCSRHPDGARRGYGFNPIFTALANMNGALRFRSGDAAVLVNGRNPKEIRPKCATKPPFKGFLASIRCEL